MSNHYISKGKNPTILSDLFTNSLQSHYRAV